MSDSAQGGFHALVEVLDRLFDKPLPERWGKWKLDRTRRAIYYDGPHDYWFSLSQMNNSTEVLDWIVELHEQKWATPEDIGNLVAALDDIFDLQDNLCGCGIEHRFNAKEHLTKLFPPNDDTGEGPTNARGEPDRQEESDRDKDGPPIAQDSAGISDPYAGENVAAPVAVSAGDGHDSFATRDDALTS